MTTPVFVVADRAAGARVEAALRRDPLFHVELRDAAALPGAEPERGDAIVVVALPAPATARVLDTLRGWRRSTAIVLLSTAPNAAWSSRARRAGVRAVLRADASAEDIAAAATAVRAGLLVLSPAALSRAPTPATLAVGEARPLTGREAEILEMMAEGMRNRAIAARLKISRYTVKFHVASILTKLAARSRTEAVTLGVRQGLISL